MAPTTVREGDMRPVRFILAALAFAGLAGCYSSDKPLITDADSVAEYSKLIFTSPEPDNQRNEFTREGKHYLTKGEGNTIRLHLKRIDGDYYVAQLTGDNDGETLFGYLHLDVAKGQAETWRTYGTDEDVQPGMHKCKDSVCIDDLAVYVAYAQKAVAEGGKPDSIMKLEVVK
jgi:hypothetical protein